MDIWSILRQNGVFYGYLVYFNVIWYIFTHFGMLYKEKSGKPWFRAWKQGRLTFDGGKKTSENLKSTKICTFGIGTYILNINQL
jgi:hypothetical protein